MRNKPKGYSIPLVGLVLLVASSVIGCSYSKPPTIVFSPSNFSFSAQQGEPTLSTDTLHISNSGSGTLDWSVSSNVDWLTLSPTSDSSIGETDNIVLSVNNSGMNVGNYAAVITISASKASNAPQTLEVDLTINPPEQDEQEEQEENVIDALDTDKLLEIGYNYPEQVVIVEGIVVGTYYAEKSNGQPTFLDFHDPYKGYFTALIWGDERYKFPHNPESYYLNKKVRIEGRITIYKGSPEIILCDPSQIWIVE